MQKCPAIHLQPRLQTKKAKTENSGKNSDARVRQCLSRSGGVLYVVFAIVELKDFFRCLLFTFCNKSEIE